RGPNLGGDRARRRATALRDVEGGLLDVLAGRTGGEAVAEDGGAGSGHYYSSDQSVSDAVVDEVAKGEVIPLGPVGAARRNRSHLAKGRLGSRGAEVAVDPHRTGRRRIQHEPDYQ